MSSKSIYDLLTSILDGISPTKVIGICIIATLGLFVAPSFAGRSAGPNTRKRPPGPPSRFLGLNKTVAGISPWEAFAPLHKKFGSVISLYQGRTLVVVLGSVKAAMDLLDKRGGIYSSRPRNIMASELMSGGMRGLSMPYGNRWRAWKSLMHAGMGIEASNGYKTLQSIESTILLHDLLTESDPTKYSAHLRRFAVSIVFCITYGRRVKYLDDPLVVANYKTDESFTKYSTPGKYIVESWPFLLKLPHFLQWFRYAPLRQRASDSKLYLHLMNTVRKQMEIGDAPPSIARRALERQEEFGLNDLETAFALSSPFTAGVGTTLATLDIFLLAMLHYPELMTRAQEEIDNAVGRSRLPQFEDADSLPYVKAMIKEIMRWRPIAPLGVPHSIIEDDTYEDMYIPKGSTVFANIYAMSKDEVMFPSHDDFDPERYLDTNSRTSAPPHSTFFFGFGRRICPGMHVAQNSIFIVITRILWACNILPAEGAGLPSKASQDFVGGLVSRPKPFTYRLELRQKLGDIDIDNVLEEEYRGAASEAEGWM